MRPLGNERGSEDRPSQLLLRRRGVAHLRARGRARRESDAGSHRDGPEAQHFGFGECFNVAGKLPTIMRLQDAGFVVEEIAAELNASRAGRVQFVFHCGRFRHWYVYWTRIPSSSAPCGPVQPDHGRSDPRQKCAAASRAGQCEPSKKGRFSVSSSRRTTCRRASDFLSFRRSIEAANSTRFRRGTTAG
jgi:hypothetical protein